MTPSWYDVLDVDQTASQDEIRAAWRASIEGLEPTDRRFKLRNEAAAVLLDPQRRAAHDAELTGGEAEVTPAPPTRSAGGVPPRSARTAGTAAAAKAPDRAATPVPPERTWCVAQAGAVVATAAKPRRSASRKPAAKPETGRRRLPLVVLPAVLAVLAVLLVVASVLALVRGSDERPLPSDSEISQAQAAAETAVVPIVAFDYRDLAENKAAAESFMTPRYRELYDQYFAAAVEGNAERTETVVQVQLISSGIVRTGPGQVDVLTFINRPTSNAEQTRVFRDQVVLRMVERGDEWLVDCLTTTAGGSCEA